MCSCVAARSWLATRQLRQLANDNNKAEKHLVARQYRSSSECSQNLFTQNAQNTSVILSVICLVFIELSFVYETEDKLFVDKSLVFSHAMCSWSAAKNLWNLIRRKNWSNPKQLAWLLYWYRESFGVVTQVIGQGFYTKVIMSRVADFWLICRWMWHSSNNSFI